MRCTPAKIALGADIGGLGRGGAKRAASSGASAGRVAVDEQQLRVCMELPRRKRAEPKSVSSGAHDTRATTLVVHRIAGLNHM
jgi:hypothetical protein